MYLLHAKFYNVVSYFFPSIWFVFLNMFCFLGWKNKKQMIKTKTSNLKHKKVAVRKCLNENLIASQTFEHYNYLGALIFHCMAFQCYSCPHLRLKHKWHWRAINEKTQRFLYLHWMFIPKHQICSSLVCSSLTNTKISFKNSYFEFLAVFSMEWPSSNPLLQLKF